MYFRKKVFLALFWCFMYQSISAQKQDSLQTYVFFKTILLDTSDQSFLMRICLWDDISQQFQLGFIPNKDLYRYVSKKNMTPSTNDYFENFYNSPEYGYKWECFFLDQKFPEVAIVNSFYLPKFEHNGSIKQILLNYFDRNGYLKEPYWPYWPQIANYLFEKRIPVRFRQGILPLEIRMIDVKKYAIAR